MSGFRDFQNLSTTGIPLRLIRINCLTDLTFNGNAYAKTVDSPGFKIIYLREGSSPNARLNVSLGASGTLIPLAPGGRIICPFQNFTVSATSRFTGYNATANFVVATEPDADLIENDFNPPAFVPVPLFADINTRLSSPPAGWPPFALGVLPTLDTNTVTSLGGHPVVGFSRIRFSLYDASTTFAANQVFLVTPYVVRWEVNSTGVYRAIEVPNAAFTLGPSSVARPAVSTMYTQIVDFAPMVSALGASDGNDLSPQFFVTYLIDWISGSSAPGSVFITAEGIV